MAVLSICTCPPAACASDIQLILTGTDPERFLTRDEIEMLMNATPSEVVKKIREIYGDMDCEKFNSVPSQFAIAYLGLFGEPQDNSLIKNVWHRDDLRSTELPPCEYYCAYEFALKLFDIRFDRKDAPECGFRRWRTSDSVHAEHPASIAKLVLTSYVQRSP